MGWPRAHPGPTRASQNSGFGRDRVLADDLPGFSVASGADFSTGGGASAGGGAGGDSTDIDRVDFGLHESRRCENVGGRKNVDEV